MANIKNRGWDPAALYELEGKLLAFANEYPSDAGNVLNVLANTTTSQVVTTNGPFAPAILRGSYDISTFMQTGNVDAATRLANANSMQSVFDTAMMNGKFIEAPPGRYEYTATKVQNGKNVGLQLNASGVLQPPGFRGSKATYFVQHATNYPAFTLGPVGSNDSTNFSMGAMDFRDLVTGFGVSQTGQTQASGFLLGQIYFSNIQGINVSPWLQLPLGGRCDAYDGLKVCTGSGEFFFSNTLDDIVISSGQSNIFWYNSNSGTGNAWGNVYLGGGGFGNRVALSGFIFNASAMYGNEFGTIQQLNLEWCSTNCLFAFGGDQITVDHLHMEGNKLTGFSPTAINLNGRGATFGTVKFYNTWLDSSFASGQPQIVHHYSDFSTNIGQMIIFWDGTVVTPTEATCTMNVRLFDTDTSLLTSKNSVQISEISIGTQTGGLSGSGAVDLDANTLNSVHGKWVGFRDYFYNTGGSRTVDGIISLSDANATVYGTHRNPIYRWDVPITTLRTITISDKCGPGSTIQANIIREKGDVIEFTRNSDSTGSSNVNIVTLDGTILGSLTGPSTTLKIYFDGIYFGISGSIVSTNKTITYSTTPSLSLMSYTNQSMTLTGNVTSLNISNFPANGTKIYLTFIQDGTGGRGIIPGSNVKSFTLGAGAANQKSVTEFVSDGSNIIQIATSGWYN